MEPGPVTRALIQIVGTHVDDRDLTARICAACVAGSDIDRGVDLAATREHGEGDTVGH